MKNLKDKLINEDVKVSSLDKIMFAMVEVTEGETPKAHLFKDLRDLEYMYEKWGGFDREEIQDICADAEGLKKNQSMIHKSSNTEYEIITALK